MKNIRRSFDRFCYRHRNQGIKNLMLWVAIVNAVVYLLTTVDPSMLIWRTLSFDRTAIFAGEVWRLVTYLFVPEAPNILIFAILLFFYYQIGRFMEGQWGVCRFNLYYFSGVLIMDAAALLLPGASASAYYLNLSLLLAFATLNPEGRVLLFFVIPLKMKWLAWFYFAITITNVVLGRSLIPVIALANYFLFFGADVRAVLPGIHLPKRRDSPNPNWAKQYQAKKPNELPYRHKCAVCGRTDRQYPDLEFRYCSKCNGYYCYCADHINNHTHIL